MWNKPKKITCLVLVLVICTTFMPSNIKASNLNDSEDKISSSDEEEISKEQGRINTGSQEDGQEDIIQEEIITEEVEVDPPSKLDEFEWISIDDYELVAESDTYLMYLYQPRLSVILENKDTGEILESTLSDEKDDGTSNQTWTNYMKSGLVINAIIGTTNTYQVDMLSTENTMDLTYKDNGFIAELYFPSYDFGLTVSVTLEGDELVVSVPSDSIIEKKSGTYITTVSLFPLMGHTYMDEQDGYMLVPDGNGALIYLDDKEGRFTNGFSQPIYGSDAGFADSKTPSLLWDRYDTIRDPNKVIAPIFGMVHSDEAQGYLAVVEDGAMRATVEAHPNGVMVNYNRCFAKFMIRDIFVQPLNNSNTGTIISVESERTDMDMQVRYLLVHGEQANYAGLAVAYRNYLLDRNLISPKDVSYNTRVDFLGTDREDWLLFKRPVVMTTVDDIKEMYSEMQDKGVGSLLSVYKGWQKGGLYDLPISKYRADRSIGKTADLTELIKSEEENDYKLHLYNDSLRINPDETNASFNVIKKINKRTYIEETYDQVYDEFRYLTPSRSSTLLSRFLKSYTKEGIDNIAISGITNNLYSYSYRGSNYSRLDTAQDYTDMISMIDEGGDLILEQPYSYLWNYGQAFLDMPLGSSNYMSVNEEVPFISMALKGLVPMYSEYVNFEANSHEYFLKLVESGVYPSFYITYENSAQLVYTNSSNLYSTEYETHKDEIISYDKEFRKLAEIVEGAYIIGHEKMDSGVTKVVYDNGVVIYINYTDSDLVVEGNAIGAMSYVIGDVR